MDDVAGMSVLKGAGDVDGDMHCVADREPAVLIEERMGTGTVNKFQDKIVQISRLILTDENGANDIREIEERPALGLAVKAIYKVLAASHLLMQNFDRNLLAQFLMVAEVNRPHAALAESAQDQEFAQTPRIMLRVGRRARHRLG